MRLRGIILAVMGIILGLVVGMSWAQEAEQAQVQLPTKVVRLHQVKAGENLHLISAYYYGDARQWKKIWNFNKKEIRNPNIIRVGQIIKVEVEPGWKPKFDLDQYLGQSQQKGAGTTEVKKPTVIREKEEVRPSITPRPKEEAGAPTTESPPEETPPEETPAPKEI